MEAFKGTTYEEYKVYAKKRRAKSRIFTVYDRERERDLNEHDGIITELANGFVEADSAGNPYCYECCVGNGYEENGIRYTTSNMFYVRFYSGNKGCTIYKSTSKSLHYYCFVCGNSIEPFGKNFFSAGCRVYEELETEQVVMLCNKDWTTFYNVKHNKNRLNYLFLKEMKKRLIKVLEYNNIIYRKQDGVYEDYKYFGLIK